MIVKTFRYLLFFAFLIVNALAFASKKPGVVVSTDLPIPKGFSKQLFYLQRDPNTNTIIYELNLKNGVPDPENPVHVFWIRYEDNGQIEELNYIQRKFAYGLSSKPIGNGNFELRFVSYKPLVLYLMKSDKDNKYHVYTTMNQKKVVLDHVFVRRIEGGSFWLPNIPYADLFCFNQASGESITVRIKPKS